MNREQHKGLRAGVLETEGYVVGQSNSSSGLFLLDGDGTWSHFGWTNIRCFAVRMSPHDQDMIFLAAGNGVLRSIDRGASWRVTNGWEMTEVLDVAVHSERPGVLMAATAFGLWFSSDNGDSWTRRTELSVRPDDSFVSCVSQDPRNPSRWLAGTENGVIWSADDGETWLGEASIRAVRRILPDPQIPGRWYMVAESGGAFRSDDDGVSWQLLPGLPAGIPLFSLAIHDSNSGRLLVGGFETGVWKSENGGDSWTHLDPPYPGCSVKSLCFGQGTSETLYLGTVENGVYVHETGSWTHLGLAESFISSLSFSQS